MHFFTFSFFLFNLTAELKAELGAQVERERELKEQLEKQLTEEQKIRGKFLLKLFFFFICLKKSKFLEFMQVINNLKCLQAKMDSK